MSTERDVFLQYIGGYPAVATVAAANTASSGSITTDVAGAGNTVECVVSPGAATVGCQIVGLLALGNSIALEATTDGTNWVPVYAIDGKGVSAGGTTGSDGIYMFGAAGYIKVRARGLPTWNAGTVAISMTSTVGSTAFVLSTPLPSGTNLIGKVGIDQTIPGTTNAVSVAALPLPLNAATEAGGNLEKLLIIHNHDLMEQLNKLLTEMRVNNWLLQVGLLGTIWELKNIDQDKLREELTLQ